MIYELYKGGYQQFAPWTGGGSTYVDYSIRKVSTNPKECRTYIILLNGNSKVFKGLRDVTGSIFSGYIKPAVAEKMIFMEML